MYIEKIGQKFSWNIFKNTEFSKYLENVNQGVWDIYKFEKDFLLTAILTTIAHQYPNLIFKGGTCLNKCYFPYFRLSEDLDFVTLSDRSRDGRKAILEEWKIKLIQFMDLFGCTWIEKRAKFDEDRQGLFDFSYISAIDETVQTIKIDITIKETLALDPVGKVIQSNFFNPLLSGDLFQKTSISCMNIDEIIAEKIRAALTRTAIRDYFDLYYIRAQTGRDFSDLKELIQIKLTEVDFAYHDGYEILKRQVETDLRPVLRDMMGFQFDEMWQFVNTFKVSAN